MERHPDEAVDAFRDRVHSTMRLYTMPLSHLSHPIDAAHAPRRRWLSIFAVSTLFGPCVPLFVRHGFLKEALGTCSVIATSLVYHYTDDIHAKYLDIVNNFSIGALMSGTAIALYGNPYPLLMASIALVGYVWEKRGSCDSSHVLDQVQHTLLVHVPVFIGFLSYFA